MKSKRFARRLLRLYPRAWRERYEDEVLALTDETGLTTGHALDLARGALREWSSFGSRHVRQFALDGISLRYEQRISVGYERFYLSSVAARLLAGGVLYAAAGPAGRWLLRADRTPIVDCILMLTPLLTVVGLYRVWAGPRRRRFSHEENAIFATDLDRYPLPSINRWLSWAVHRASGAHVPRPSLSMSPIEAAGWILIAFIGVAWLDVIPARFAESDRWLTLYWSWQTMYGAFVAGGLVTSSIAAVVRRHVSSGRGPLSSMS